MENQNKGEIIMYRTEDGLTEIQTTLVDDTVWLNRAQMAELFQRDRSVIGRHIKNVFEEGELDRERNVQNLHIPNSDKLVEFYSLDVIISVGYRVKSLRGTQFRIWANGILKEYLKKGFAMDDARLKNLGGGNYWKELLDRIRDIRSSEKVSTGRCLTCMPPVMLHAEQPGNTAVLQDRAEQTALCSSWTHRS